MSSDEATSPPTFTVAVLPKMMPDWLTRKTLPLAESEPMISDGFWSVMRLSTLAVTPGCLNWTPALSPILKLCQLTIICGVSWLMVTWLPLVTMLPLPDVICPPPGIAPGSMA